MQIANCRFQIGGERVKKVGKFRKLGERLQIWGDCRFQISRLQIGDGVEKVGKIKSWKVLVENIKS